MLEIRKAKAEDSRSILEVNVKTWCTSYEGIVPKSFLQYRIDTIEEQIKRCETTVEQDDNVYVAVVDGQVVGIMSYGVGRNVGYENFGEIYTLYVLKEYQNQGIGKKLFLKGMQELKEKKYHSIIVNCLTENKANDFYAKMGGKVIGMHEIEIGGKKIKENTILYS